MSKSILLVEDDADDRMLFTEALYELTADVRLRTASHCDDGIDSLIKPHDELPDLVVMDINMPGKNGLECLEDIRSHSRLYTLPVVILSTDTDESVIEDAYRRGANFYISKPNSFQALKREVHKLITTDWKSFPRGQSFR
ncbi:MAG TPA: response regulator [Cyclobacteriaceae bacterium]|nr:response regulator [Cyclobacteriaceae bacterium]HMV11182.1 response regulator [Cyclobacteriaceae bacterium]HMV91301.1 response regulator [Cyclobacteriaceae bacterium]HMX01726.1 response regulator [Cyclobacteriaceae bacterium]HMX51403.1 response regulator [Cyclobacteriaceae bacterium]